MSRAFVKEDADEPEPRYSLPDRDDPAYPAFAAWALLEGWSRGDPHSAERATGYKWGAPELREHVERFLEEAIERQDERLETIARRFLRKARSAEMP